MECTRLAVESKYQQDVSGTHSRAIRLKIGSPETSDISLKLPFQHVGMVQAMGVLL